MLPKSISPMTRNGFYRPQAHFAKSMWTNIWNDMTILVAVIPVLTRQSGSRLNIKMSFYHYMDPHVKDKTVSRPSATVLSLTWESTYLEKTVFILRQDPGHNVAQVRAAELCDGSRATLNCLDMCKPVARSVYHFSRLHNMNVYKVWFPISSGLSGTGPRCL